MGRGESGRRRLLGLVTLCMLLAVAVVCEATVAIAVGGDDVAAVAKAKGGKVIASPRFDVPDHILAPPRPAGSPTVTYTITGKLVMRGCFTSASSNGRKVKCSGAVLKACVESRTIDVYAPYALIRRQSVSAGVDGSFTATVESGDDYLEVDLSVGAKRVHSKRQRINCYAGSDWIDISEARP